MRMIFFFCVWLLYSQQIKAQEPQQTIRGQVLAANSEKPLSNATISLVNTNPFIGTTTDEEGRFRIEYLDIGRYQLEISHISYQTKFFPELLVEAGKELVLNIRLEESDISLTTVDIEARRPSSRLTPLSTYEITVEQTLRLPATFFDPARQVMTYPGVAASSDQANHLSIRGNSPNHLAWRLEDVDIVNPNHLTNAGTFNDRASQNGGGVNILSAQMLGTSTFRTGALSANYGNALSGLMDMHLRKGNDEKREYTAQIGLIGLDFAAEGPISKEKRSSYLINYRYSTLGLLSALGVDLGEEKISFQDIAFHLNFPSQKAGQFSLFGMGGISENIFEAERDTSTWEFEKDRFDIRYDSKMGAIGATHKISTGDKGFLKTVVVFSAQETQRLADELDAAFTLRPLTADLLQESRRSMTTVYTHQLSQGSTLESGVLLTHYTFDLDVRANQDQSPLNRNAIGRETAWLVEPFVRMEVTAFDHLKLDLGWRYRHFGLYSKGSLETRAALNWAFSDQQTIKLAYGLHSQLQPAILFYEIDANEERVNNLNAFARTHHLVLGYTYAPNYISRFKAELYAQRLSGFPIPEAGNSTFSGINLISGFPSFTTARSLTAQGEGLNYGLELSYQRHLADDYYFLLNGSLFDSQYTDQHGIKRDTRFNSQYVFNLTAGKEWIYTKKSRKRIFGINARLNYHGGFRDTPIDEIQSAIEGQTVYQEEQAFSINPKDYFKLDLRISLKNNKRKFSSTLALDIQNVSNQQNIAYTYFDTQKNAVLTEYQLGIIPILSYRIEF